MSKGSDTYNKIRYLHIEEYSAAIKRKQMLFMY